MTSALLAITLLSLLVAGLALIWAYVAQHDANAAWKDATATYAKWIGTLDARREAEAELRERLAAAERRARSRESKYSRRQPETPAPLPENVT